MTKARVAFALLLVISLGACDDPRDDLGRGGDGSIADIAVFLADDATDKEVAAMWDVLTVPHRSGDGVATIDGVFAVDFDYERKAVYVRLNPETTGRRASELIQLLLEAPEVEDVERDFLVGSDRP